MSGGRNADETDPFARLEQTHRRLEDRIAELKQAVAELGFPNARSAAVETIHAVAGFFSRGAVRHVEDEERTLFPRLAPFAELRPVMAELEREHAVHAALERELLELAQGIGPQGPDAAAAERLTLVARKLGEVYREHIRREERDLFPRARALLGAQVVEEMGQEMMERRPDRGRR